MATQQLMVPIEYTINVNVTRQDPGLATPNTSNIALFTADATNIEGDYGAYVEVDSALAAVNADSLTAQMITALFAPNATFRNNDGQLFIVPITSTEAEAIESAEDYIALITEKKKQIPFFGVLIDTFDFDFDMTQFFTYVDTQSFLYGYGVKDYTNLDLSEYKGTEGLYTGGDLVNTKQAIAAFVSLGTSANWNGSDTALTMNLKSLAPILAPGQIDTTIIGALKEKGISAYAITAGESEVYSHKNAGGYWDDKIGGKALRLELQYNLYNLAKTTPTKIAQNESGVNMVRNAASQAWQKFIDNGFLTTGIDWMGTSTFGDKEAFLRSIVQNGYYQYNKPLSTQTAAERATRTITIQGAGQSAGAIHFVTYNAILA